MAVNRVTERYPVKGPVAMLVLSLVASGVLTFVFPIFPGTEVASRVTSFAMFTMATYMMVPAMSLMVLGIRGETLERREKQAEREARDKDAWAKELVGKVATLDAVGHLQAVLDTRRLGTRSRELEASLPTGYENYLHERWTPEEVAAIQRAIDSRTGTTHTIDL